MKLELLDPRLHVVPPSSPTARTHLRLDYSGFSLRTLCGRLMRPHTPPDPSVRLVDAAADTGLCQRCYRIVLTFGDGWVSVISDGDQQESQAESQASPQGSQGSQESEAQA